MKLVQSHFDRNSKIRCRCQDCLNINFQTQDVVYDDLLLKGTMKDYVQWIYHGEQSPKRDNDEAIYSENENEERINKEDASHNEIHAMLEEISGRSKANVFKETTTDNNAFDNLSDSEAKKFDNF